MTDVERQEAVADLTEGVMEDLYRIVGGFPIDLRTSVWLSIAGTSLLEGLSRPDVERAERPSIAATIVQGSLDGADLYDALAPARNV